MTDIPQWALERADEIVKGADFERLRGYEQPVYQVYGGELEALKDSIARALAEAAPKWRTDMENIPRDGAPFIVGGLVQHVNGNQWWESHVVWLDDETGEIPADCECPFDLEDFEHWMPLPKAPEVG